MQAHLDALAALAALAASAALAALLSLLVLLAFSSFREAPTSADTSSPAVICTQHHIAPVGTRKTDLRWRVLMNALHAGGRTPALATQQVWASGGWGKRGKRGEGKVAAAPAMTDRGPHRRQRPAQRGTRIFQFVDAMCWCAG